MDVEAKRGSVGSAAKCEIIFCANNFAFIKRTYRARRLPDQAFNEVSQLYLIGFCCCIKPLFIAEMLVTGAGVLKELKWSVLISFLKIVIAIVAVLRYSNSISRCANIIKHDQLGCVLQCAFDHIWNDFFGVSSFLSFRRTHSATQQKDHLCESRPSPIDSSGKIVRRFYEEKCFFFNFSYSHNAVRLNAIRSKNSINTMGVQLVRYLLQLVVLEQII